METRAAAAAATRERLVDAVLRVIAEAGADAATMQAVADRADVALRTLYNHFATREELIGEAMGRLLDDTRTAVRELVPEAGSPRERLLAFVDAYYRSYERQGAAAGALLHAQDIPEVEVQVRDIRSWRRQQLTRMLRAVDAEAPLRMPLSEAVGLAYALTAYAMWSALTNDIRLSANAARAVARHTVERALL